MYQFSKQEEAFLQQLGRSEEGKILIQILNKAAVHYTSIKNIESGVDYGAAVEGGKLFDRIVSDFVRVMSRKVKKTPFIGPDNFE